MCIRDSFWQEPVQYVLNFPIPVLPLVVAGRLFIRQIVAQRAQVVAHACVLGVEEVLRAAPHVDPGAHGGVGQRFGGGEEVVFRAGDVFCRAEDVLPVRPRRRDGVVDGGVRRAQRPGEGDDLGKRLRRAQAALQGPVAAHGEAADKGVFPPVREDGAKAPAEGGQLPGNKLEPRKAAVHILSLIHI